MPDNSPEARAKHKQETLLRNATCKDCGKEPRLNGSSRGQACKDSYWKHHAATQRLNKKIEQQTAAK